jgi:glycerol-3-phosphate dehydrogenase
MITTMASRVARRSELRASRYDLLVIGGGILGTAVTWTAAQAPAACSQWPEANGPPSGTSGK